jgi:excisionase family DNA binding protein
MDTVLLNVEEAAHALGLGRSKCYELVLKGQLKSLKIGRSRKIPVEAIKEFIRERLDEIPKDSDMHRPVS